MRKVIPQRKLDGESTECSEKDVRNKNLYTVAAVLRILFIAAGLISNRPVSGQTPELQARVQEIMHAAAKNKQALGRYTWVEQVTISVEGEQKKQEHFQARLGPDSQPQETSLDTPPVPSPREGRWRTLKEHLVVKRTEDYQEYAARMKSLANQYLPPDKDRLQQAWDRGDITPGTAAGSPSELQLIIHNYLEPSDLMTLVIDSQKQVISVQVATYLGAPRDAMTLTVHFTRLPGGSDQISNTVICCPGRQLNIAIQDSDYQRM